MKVERFRNACSAEYHAVLGEGGLPFSSGERQRISIVRAILKDAPIILLDRATAALDPENEPSIRQAIGELVRSKTVVMIAHRLNTVANADQIIVLDYGEGRGGRPAPRPDGPGRPVPPPVGRADQAHGWKLGAG